MLIISRREFEWFCVQTSDGPIWIGINELRRGKVRIMIEAPEVCRIAREELLPDDQKREQPK